MSRTTVHTPPRIAFGFEPYTQWYNKNKGFTRADLNKALAAADTDPAHPGIIKGHRVIGTARALCIDTADYFKLNAWTLAPTQHNRKLSGKLLSPSGVAVATGKHPFGQGSHRIGLNSISVDLPAVHNPVGEGFSEFVSQLVTSLLTGDQYHGYIHPGRILGEYRPGPHGRQLTLVLTAQDIWDKTHAHPVDGHQCIDARHFITHFAVLERLGPAPEPVPDRSYRFHSRDRGADLHAEQKHYGRHQQDRSYTDDPDELSLANLRGAIDPSYFADVDY